MRALVTGGIGFIGTNLSHRLLSNGNEVILFDNLSRAGVQNNLDWLKATHGKKLHFVQGDIRDFDAVLTAIRNVDAVFHLAAQVAVTTSVSNPREDFSINAQGTLNVLEAARRQEPMPVVLYTSTNKVYGALEHLGVVERSSRYEFENLPEGVSETCPLDFHSPYGCSKGAADQYVRDYARMFGIPAVVLRMSCIAGPRQFGNEDQGWVAHFLYSALQQIPLVIYGDGRQVRDVLCVDDLMRAFEAVRAKPASAGEIYNVGGGADNSVSLLELIA